MDHVSYSRLHCACGHKAIVGTSRWLHRDEMLRRFRCSKCGQRPEWMNAVAAPVHRDQIKMGDVDVRGVVVHQV